MRPAFAAALHVARWGGGSGKKLFSFIILLGAAVAALFANDGARADSDAYRDRDAAGAGFQPGSHAGVCHGGRFIADTASLPLVVSNLVNIVSADYFRLGFGDYAAVMVPVTLAAVLATLLMLHLFSAKSYRSATIAPG